MFWLSVEEPGNALGGLGQRRRTSFAADLCVHSAASRGRVFFWNLISVSILPEKTALFLNFWRLKAAAAWYKSSNRSGPSRTTPALPTPPHAHPAEPQICIPAFIPSLKRYKNAPKCFSLGFGLLAGQKCLASSLMQKRVYQESQCTVLYLMCKNTITSHRKGINLCKILDPNLEKNKKKWLGSSSHLAQTFFILKYIVIEISQL